MGVLTNEKRACAWSCGAFRSLLEEKGKNEIIQKRKEGLRVVFWSFPLVFGEIENTQVGHRGFQKEKWKRGKRKKRMIARGLVEPFHSLWRGRCTRAMYDAARGLRQ